MASEILAVPEDHLLDVIKVIRVGLNQVGHEVPKEVREQLRKWCDEEEEYMAEGR